MGTPRNRILLVTLGSRGDVQPFCVLGRELKARGYAVTLLASRDYAGLIERFGLGHTDIGAAFEDLVREPKFDDLLRHYFTPNLRRLLAWRELSRRIADEFTRMLLRCLEETRSADLVVFNPMAFFAGELAGECGVPSIRVSCQPLLPSRRMILSTLGSRDRGPALNRLSYELFRPAALLLRRSFRAFRRASGAGHGLHAFINPLTYGLDHSHQLMAYSPALSPDPGDWPVEATMTGFWYDEPRPDEVLPERVSAFLASGPPPVFISFGSMLWGAQRNTDVVMQALEVWGGRAILGTGADGLTPPPELPPNVIAVPALSHALLFPHLAGIVHHGGAGTTAAALRCGLPSVILPMLGDQLYWGRRVAAIGAGETPLPLAQVTPGELARRLAALAGDGRYRAAAKAMAAVLAREPGISAAIACIDAVFSAGATLQ